GQSSSGPLAAGRVTAGGAGGAVVGGVAGPAEAAFLAPAPPPGRPESAWSRASHRNCQVPPSTWCTASSTGSGAAASILAWTPCWNHSTIVLPSTSRTVASRATAAARLLRCPTVATTSSQTRRMAAASISPAGAAAAGPASAAGVSMVDGLGGGVAGACGVAAAEGLGPGDSGTGRAGGSGAGGADGPDAGGP